MKKIIVCELDDLGCGNIFSFNDNDDLYTIEMVFIGKRRYEEYVKNITTNEMIPFTNFKGNEKCILKNVNPI